MPKPSSPSQGAFAITLHQLRAHRKLLAWVKSHSPLASERQRAHVLLALTAGFSQPDAARACHCARSTVVRLTSRLRECGLWALVDRRRSNGAHHPHARRIRERLPELVRMPPERLGWGRSRWSHELLSGQLAREFGRGYHPGHIGRVLAQCDIRRVVPKLCIARQPWDHKEQAFRLFERFVGLPEGDVVLFADEVDVCLNPKLGPVLAVRPERPVVQTPGQNEKRYIAGSYNPVTGHVVWVWAEHKRSALFIELCRELASRYRGWGTVHLVLDNYSIHCSRATRDALAGLGGKIQLHFLPQYSPEYNDIERVWGAVHDAVTRCHRCTCIQELCERVDLFLEHVRDHGLRAASLFPAP